jgi:magnesium-transporting ATPase (P-type)
MDNFDDRINQILLLAAAVSIFIGVIREGIEGLTDGLSILVALFIIIFVNSANDYTA